MIQTTQQMPEPHDHCENHIELLPVEPVAMSLYLPRHDVLRTQNLMKELFFKTRCAASATAHHESAQDQASVHGLCQRCRRAADIMYAASVDHSYCVSTPGK